MHKSYTTTLLNDAHYRDNERNGSESYSSDSSFSDTYSDGSDLANWEEFVAEDGTLFYAEYKPHKLTTTTTTINRHNNTTTTTTTLNDEKRIEFARNNSLRLNKKISRRQQQQQQQQHNNNNNSKQQNTDNIEQFKFSHINGKQAQKQLQLVITAADRYRFGRRSTAVESILGFRVVPYPDQPECLMVHSFVLDIQQQQQQKAEQMIQRGDWFKSLNDIEIRASNIEELLLQFLEPTKVCLQFQAAQLPAASAENGNSCGDSSSGALSAKTANEWQKIANFAQFVQIFKQLQLQAPHLEETQELMPAFGLLILPPECYQQDEHKDSLFYYPPNDNNVANFLYKTRGSFLTLNAVLSEELQTRPQLAKISIDQQMYYVCFRTLNGFLVLFAYAAQCLTLAEAQLRANELIGYMRFTLPQLGLNSFSQSPETRRLLYLLCSMQRTRLLHTRQRGECQFEQLLKESCHMPLPKEAQLRIFDALSEMEAMDYRNWNDEPLNTHREFFIHGSVLYYDHLLLATQLPLELRHSVESYMRCRGIFEFISGHNVKELYVWEEIALPNASGRYFLTICSRSHLILAVVLKIFDAPDMPLNAVVPPSLFYIEEIQETLDHLIQCGIESLAMFWSVSNKRPEVVDKIQSTTREEKETRKLEAFIKQKLNVGVATGSTLGVGSSISSAASVLSGTSSGLPTRSISYDEETHLCTSLGGGSSVHSLTPSEDDASRKRQPNADDSDSGSDWENFAEQHPLRLDGDYQLPMTESLWKEINNVVPVKISAGWKNAVFYYVYVDSVNGTVFCPLKANSETFPFLREMRRACHMIHLVLQQTKKLRRLLAQEATTVVGSTSVPGSSTNGNNHNSGNTVGNSRGIFAIKEHGLTIDVCEQLLDEQHGQELPQRELLRGRFAVIGRLFHAPTKEVYVCHRPDVPQNMVEMAFRLSFFAVG